MMQGPSNLLLLIDEVTLYGLRKLDQHDILELYLNEYQANRTGNKPLWSMRQIKKYHNELFAMLPTLDQKVEEEGENETQAIYLRRLFLSSEQ